MTDNDGATGGTAQTKAMDMAIRSQASTSHFLRLPGEIRNTIYAYVLENQYYVKPRYRSKTMVSVFKGRWKYRIALLKVCREIYTETSLLPFSIGASALSPTSKHYALGSRRNNATPSE
ncbi:hypothetical protein NX059_003635 [Plenodomus lindquistii]|nr:hypothetical protein NX059_003635 [Plenodomus lindquistii]